MNEHYVNGFMAKCAELGVDPEQVIKMAAPPAAKIKPPETAMQHRQSALAPARGDLQAKQLALGKQMKSGPGGAPVDYLRRKGHLGQAEEL